VTLVNDQLVAENLRLDFQTILMRLTQVLESQQRMYQEYLELKKQQVELLQRLQSQEQRRRASAD
jgi:hypothetical protein